MSIKNNTTSLQSLLEQVNSLPEAENLNVEISTQSTLLSEQDAKIAELAQVLAGKVSGGNEQPTLINFTLVYGNINNPTTINLQSDDKLNWGQWIFSSYNPLKYSTENGIKIDYEEICFIFAGGIPAIVLNNINVTVFDQIQDGATYYAIYNSPTDSQ